MATQAPATLQTIYPCLYYRDAPAAIAWLGEAFGTRTLMSVPGDKPNTVAHAELSLDGQIVMLSTAKPEQGWNSPRDLDGISGLLYIVVDDVDAHCTRARAAGAEIMLEPTSQDYGGRDYLARDPEGNQWSFGTYRPHF